ncbi:MAG: SGNH/GDSL hydrolase family protein [Oscillospiraceae bacterium]|nr:SGNH/GDSL hydrolase family protein [Oscillospiraceae bacterium]
MKKLLSMLLASVVMLSACACSQDEKSKSDSADSAATTTTSQVIEEIVAEPTNFDIYVSNTYLATGNNQMITDVNNVTFRAYIPIEEYGELEYCFYFSNMVDSTYSMGEIAYGGRPGAEFTIHSASISDGGTSNAEPLTNTTAVTFDGGSTTKEVGYMETFWTDPVSFNVPDGHFLVWEWTITGAYVPCNNMSSLTHTSKSVDGGSFGWCDEIPIPNLIGAKREVNKTIACIGDSITQGCQTTSCQYDFWVADIARDLGSDYSVWNLGLGWSRSSDCALNGDWLNRAKQADIVTVAFGTNDVISGKYGNNRPDTCDEMLGYIDTIVTELKNAGCEVIIFTAPPFDFPADSTQESTRVEFNEALVTMAQEKECELFDFATVLADPADYAKTLYGGHPNGEGCRVVADKFLLQFDAMIKE